jgi:uncharacterized protein (DUF433 family)
MTNLVHREHARLDVPLYTYAEASRLARLAPSTAWAWLSGDSHSHPAGNGRRPSAMAGANSTAQEGASFLELGKDRPVVVDPDYGFGFPIMDGTNIRTEIRYERFKAGELSEEIAADFRLDRKQVERALQFEAERHAA